jgi:hypothetical protein
VQLPVPTNGPFSPDVDALFDEASKAVRARPEIVDQLQALEHPLDLAAVITGEREVLGSVVADQVNRYTALTGRLHERLVARSDASRIEELEGLAERAASVHDLIRMLAFSDPDKHKQLRIEFRALVTEWESLRRDIVSSLESAMFSTVLTAVNTSLTEESAPRMHVTSFDGLRQSLTNEQIVITDVYDQVEDVIRERQDGSFGIAGPRGVGKSTLINYFATTRGVHRRQEFEQSRPRLGVVVSAPVAYEAREFVLHLHAELCNRVVGDTRGVGPTQPRSVFYLPTRWLEDVLVLGGPQDGH